VVGTAVMTALFPLKGSMHLSLPPVYDHHHIGYLKLSDTGGTLVPGSLIHHWFLPQCEFVLPSCLLTGEVATCSGKEYREPRQCHPHELWARSRLVRGRHRYHGKSTELYKKTKTPRALRGEEGPP